VPLVNKGDFDGASMVASDQLPHGRFRYPHYGRLNLVGESLQQWRLPVRQRLHRIRSIPPEECGRFRWRARLCKGKQGTWATCFAGAFCCCHRPRLIGCRSPEQRAVAAGSGVTPVAEDSGVKPGWNNEHIFASCNAWKLDPRASAWYDGARSE